MYSPINKAAYCFCCLLFTSSPSNSRASFELKNGFNKWRKPEKLKSHENNPSHRRAFTTWKEAESWTVQELTQSLKREIGDCRMLLSNRTEGQLETPLALLGFIVSFGDDVFPNLRISLQILLTIPVSIASCERSFSKLKLILSYSRASMGQDRLSDLALLSVERETLEKQILMT